MRKQIALIAIVSAFVGGFATQALAEKQPHMKNALALLEDARKQLDNATPDKGGHRVKALELVNSAIAEVKQGIEFDNKH